MNLKKFFYDKNKNNKKTTIRLFRIPIYRRLIDNNYRKKYFFGILFSKKLILQGTDIINKNIKHYQDIQNDLIKNITNHYDNQNNLIKQGYIKFSIFEKEFMNFTAIEKYFNEIKNSTEKNAIFLAGSMAIAEYTVKIHSNDPESFDIFADVQNFAEWNYLRSLHKNAYKNVFPISSFKTISKIQKYKNKIFVLGNSEHHKEVLKIACETKGESNRWFILHEPYLIGLFWSFITDDFNKFITNYYPNIKEQINEVKDINSLLLKNHNYFIRPLIEMTGIKNFILYSKKNEETLLSEQIKHKDIKTFSLPFPIQKLENILPSKYIFPDVDCLIGSFGMPNDLHKRISLLIQAVHLLNKTGQTKVKLLIAGISAGAYEKTVDSNLKQDVIFLDNVQNNDWLPLLNSVDFAVQLRENAFSFSSASVAELLGIGKRTLVTKGMVESEWEKAGYVRFIDEGLNVKEMAEVLKDEIQNKYTPKKYDKIYNEYSFENNCQRIKTILDENL